MYFLSAINVSGTLAVRGESALLLSLQEGGLGFLRASFPSAANLLALNDKCRWKLYKGVRSSEADVETGSRNGSAPTVSDG
jgi:hypothetical protein